MIFLKIKGEVIWSSFFNFFLHQKPACEMYSEM